MHIGTMAAQTIGRRACLLMSSVSTAHLAPGHLAAPHVMPSLHRQSVSLSSAAQLRSLRFARMIMYIMHHAVACKSGTHGLNALSSRLRNIV